MNAEELQKVVHLAESLAHHAADGHQGSVAIGYYFSGTLKEHGAYVLAEIARMADRECASCGQPAEGNYSIHRDGFCIGPEVDLCNACGKDPEPSLPELWEAIAKRVSK